MSGPVAPGEITIAPGLDPLRLQPIFRRTRRLHIPDVLPGQTAAAICQALIRDTPWKRSLFLGDRGVALDFDELAAMPADARARLDQGLAQRARDGFQYAFDSWSVSDEVEAGRRTGHPAESFYDFLNAPAFLQWVRAVTGDDRPRYCDAQCTRFNPGDYLNGHTDEAEGKNRLYAYVMNLTPKWTVDWGGVLLFIDQDGHVAEGYTPAFNALNIFEVPQPHSVSIVAPFAGTSRLAITGWIRSAGPDA
ncbi:2OG-Fe(II) oxygenase [Brevundimonas sp.]|uniref:2OG-Fe(II) oxygenase n=1 Tax=Brevundimonas sp. TaxID=1871086 RepID=UPI00391A7457